VVVIVVLNLTMDTTHATSVQADRVKSRDVIEVVSGSGRVQPQTKVDITSEINGEIVGLYVNEGDRVALGELLVVLDTVQLRSEVDQARYATNELSARLEGSKTALDQAQEEYERQQRLYEGKLTSETAYKNAKYAYESSRSSYLAAKAQADQFRARYEQQLDYLSKAKIVSPMDGIITYLDCEVGEIAAAQTSFTQGRTLMTIADLSVFEVEVEIDETEITKVELSQEAEIEIDAFPDTTFVGEVVEVGNTAILTGMGSQEQSTNFRVKVIFKEPDQRIRPGMSASVDITSCRRDKALTIPYSAVVMRSLDPDSLARAQRGESEPAESVGSSEVHAAEVSDSGAVGSDSVGGDEVEREEIKGTFVIRDGVAGFVPIETGIADRKYIEVTSGLEDGDTVVSGPYRVLRNIKEGDMVEVQNDIEERD